MQNKESRSAIIHSSLKEVRRLGTDSELPSPVVGYSLSIGTIIRINHFGGACLETHTPKLSSLIEGETFECDLPDLDTELRVRMLTLAATCRSLASELLDHASRLESRAKSESDLIDTPDDRPESPESEVHIQASGIGETTKSDSRIDSRAESRIKSQVKSLSKSRTRTPAPDLSLFD